MSANAVTYLMWIVGIAGGVCLIYPDWSTRLIGCILLFLINVLDTSDGEVARYLDTCSPFGVILDKIVHFTTNQVIYFCFAFGLYLESANELWVLLGFGLIFVTTSDDILKELFTVQAANSSENAKKTKLQLSYNKSSLLQFFVSISFANTGFYHLFGIFVLLDLIIPNTAGQRFFFEIAYVLIYLFVNLVKVLIRYKKIQKLTRNNHADL